jgi:hypothetical protein
MAAQAVPEFEEVSQQEQAEAVASPVQLSEEDLRRGQGSEGLLDQIVEQQVRTQAERLHVEELRFEFQQRRAKLFAASGLFAVRGVDGPQALAQAMVKIELGESMGFSPAESLQGIAIINGATAIAAALRAARMQAAGVTWDLQWLGTDDSPLGCRLWPYFKGKPLVQPRRDEVGNLVAGTDGKVLMDRVCVAFTRKDAERMLTSIWDDKTKQKRRCSILEKENWQMAPKNMYFARAVTNLQRFHFPGVLSVNMPSIEEAMDFDQDSIQTRPQPIRASIGLEDLKPSQDANRGHDATAGTEPVAEAAADGSLFWDSTTKAANPYEAEDGRRGRRR